MASSLPVQTLGAKHPNDPTVTTLQQPADAVTDQGIQDATLDRLGLPRPTQPGP